MAVRPGGEFFLDLTSTTNLASLPESSQVVLAHDYPVTGPATQFLTNTSDPVSIGLPHGKGPAAPVLYTGVYIAANVSVLGSTVDLQGTMAGNGDFTLQAQSRRSISARSPARPASRSATRRHYGFNFTGTPGRGLQQRATSAAAWTRA